MAERALLPVSAKGQLRPFTARLRDTGDGAVISTVARHAVRWRRARVERPDHIILKLRGIDIP